MYSCVLYSQNTDKGNEPDGKRIEYTDEGKVLNITWSKSEKTDILYKLTIK